MQKKLEFASADQVVKGEILSALHFAENDYSFHGAVSNSVMFEMMLPDSLIAKNYSRGKRKINCYVNYGITLNLKEKFVYDVCKTPFSFKFNETTN